MIPAYEYQAILIHYLMKEKYEQSTKKPGTSRRHFYFTQKLRHAHASYENCYKYEFCKVDQDLSEYVKNLAENQF